MLSLKGSPSFLETWFIFTEPESCTSLPPWNKVSDKERTELFYCEKNKNKTMGKMKKLKSKLSHLKITKKAGKDFNNLGSDSFCSEMKTKTHRLLTAQGKHSVLESLLGDVQGYLPTLNRGTDIDWTSLSRTPVRKFQCKAVRQLAIINKCINGTLIINASSFVLSNCG